jgi:hypothetical protein
MQRLFRGSIKGVGGVSIFSKLPVGAGMNEDRWALALGRTVQQCNTQQRTGIKHGHHLVEAGRLGMDGGKMKDGVGLAYLHKSGDLLMVFADGVNAV